MTVPAPAPDDEAPARGYDRRLVRRLLAYVRPYGWLVAAALVLLLVEGVLQLAGPWLTRRVIDVALPARDATMIRTAAALYALSLAASFACAYGETILTALLGQRVMRDLRAEIFTALQRLPISFFDRNPVGRLVTRATSDVEALNELFTAGVVAGLGDLFTLAAIGVMMLAIDWRLALAAFAVIPLVYLTSYLFQRSVRVTYREIRSRLARINAYLQERIGGMRIVQLFGRERDEVERFATLNRAHLDAHLRSITVYALYFPVIEVLTSVALGVLIVSGAQRVAVDTLTVGTVAAFLQLLRRFFQPLQDLSDKFNTLQQAMAASERLFALLDEPGAPAPASAAGRARRRGTTRAVRIAFEDVWFAYGGPEGGSVEDGPHARISEGDGRERSAWVLEGVTFVAEPGDRLALVGHTGAGKSTIVSLLLRFYDPQRGRITMDGVDVRDLDLRELRALIGYVQQDLFLFAGDVASNIRLASPLSDDAVRAALAQVGALSIVERLPDGLAHRLGERGASLSVGERQLLSFARAVAADPAVLVLDEATSAVDSVIESEIHAALATAMRGRTTIAIAHRLSTILDATEILVLHQGRIMERGKHQALLARRGLYERLWRLQVGASAASGAAPAPAVALGQGGAGAPEPGQSLAPRST